MHYYQHHIGDFIKATARLTDAQSMSYLRLLWMYYDSEKPLKSDVKVLAFQIGASKDETELLLMAFFTLSENGWHHTRCDQEIAEYRSFLEKKSNAGRASAQQRKNNSSTDVQQVFNKCSTDVQLTTNHKPLTTNQLKTKTQAERPDSVSQEVWQDFIAIRDKVKKPFTETALKIMQGEAVKAGYTIQKALETCCARGWMGFEAKWVIEKQTASEARIAQMSALTRGMSTPKPVQNFWDKPAIKNVEVIDVEVNRLL